MPSRRRIRQANNAPQNFLTNNTNQAGTADALFSKNNNNFINNNQSKTLLSSSSLSSNNNKCINGGGGGGVVGGGIVSVDNKINIGNGSKLTQKQIQKNYLITLTKEELKNECKKRGQKTNGNRTELLQRLGVKMSQIKNCYQEDLQNRSKLSKQHQQNHNNNNIYKNSIDSTTSSNSVNIINKKTTNSHKGAANGSTSNGTMFLTKKHSTQKSQKERDREEREKIVLWRRPIQTIKYSTLECITLTQTYGKQLLQHQIFLFVSIVLIGIVSVLLNIPGRHQIVIEIIRSNTWFVVYWVGLGVLSSVGLGTGLHTFLLYLGPHIASVTLAAYECNALNFPKPPYPDEIICPEVQDTNIVPNLWNIMAKVRFEAFLWGAGTALGELPPYFMAKAARLSGYDPEDAEDLKEFEELKKKQTSGNLSRMDRAKLFMERVVEKVGFFGILACASIPNPLFDLAGITCGHFLVPFWTFFGATLLGKAVIKMHIQKIFVIIAFNESLIERAVDLLILIPIFGKRLQEPFKGFLSNQKQRLHRNQRGKKIGESGNLLSKIFEYFVVGMICYFVISIVNSLAQNYYKRIHKKSGKTQLKKIAKE